MTQTNGHKTHENLATILPPLALRELAGVDSLPFNELVEIRLAMATTQEVTHDALAELAELPHNEVTTELLEQLAHADGIRAWYVQRLSNLVTRIMRCDMPTIEAVFPSD